MSLSYPKQREELTDLVRVMFDRFMTNAAGGNVAVRVGENRVLVTPSLMSERHLCRIAPEDLLLLDLDGNILEGEGKRSRETDMHLSLFKGMPQAGASVHAHPKYTMVFVAYSIPLPSVIEATGKHGTVYPLERYCRNYSPELCRAVVDMLVPRAHELASNCVACLIPRHGMIAVGKDLMSAYNMVERIETDAFCTLMSGLLVNNPALKVNGIAAPEDRFREFLVPVDREKQKEEAGK